MKIIAAVPSKLEFFAIKGVLDKYGCPGLICGIGPVMTAHVLTRHFDASSPEILLLCGLGGRYSAQDHFDARVFLADKEILADLGRCAGDSIKPLHIVGEELETSFSLSEKWESALNQDLLVSEGFHPAAMATVSCVSASRQRASLIKEYFGAEVENMEGASAALVCRHYDVVLYELRAVSNIAGEADHSRWRIQDALNSLSLEVDRFLALLYR